MPELRIFGSVGKATTRAMVESILQSVGSDGFIDGSESVLVLLSADAEGQSAAADPADDARVVANADAIAAAGLPASAVTFGLTEGAAVRASGLDATLDGTTFTLRAEGEEHRVALRLLGEHQVMNALAAIAVARIHAVPLGDAISALETLDTAGPGRMERLHAASDIVIINDAVSARPESVAAALKALAQIAGSRRTVAVLGEMSWDEQPLDEESVRAAHDRIGRLVVRLNIKKLIAVGYGARHIHNAAGLEGSWDGESVLVDSGGEAYDLLRDELRSQDVVLVKASEDTGLDDLAGRLTGVAR